MKKTVALEAFFDYSYGDGIFQIPYSYEDEVDCCDCCEEQIKEDQNIGLYPHDYCHKCYDAGGVARCLKVIYQEPEEYFHIINKVRDKYDKLKTLKLI